MDDDRERALLVRCQHGDRDAFAALVESCERPVFGVAYRMLGNVSDAADAAQSVFLKVFEHLGEYDGKHRAFSWIYRIAVNEALDRLQWRKRNGAATGAESGGTIGQEEVSLEERVASTDGGPEQSAEAGQLHDCVQAALMELHKDHRAVIVLRHFSGCSYEEMANILHLPEKTVKSRLHTARQVLRKHLCAHGVETA
jgi:RNA polymerase sigma-70 factor (ECF subfamily)